MCYRIASNGSVSLGIAPERYASLIAALLRRLGPNEDVILVEEAIVSYEVPDGVETVRDAEVVYDEETAHWELRPESGTVVRIPRERVYRVEGTPDTSSGAESERADPPSSAGAERETDEYGHPL